MATGQTYNLGINVAYNAGNSLTGLTRTANSLDALENASGQAARGLQNLDRGSRAAGQGLQNLNSQVFNTNSIFKNLASTLGTVFAVDKILDFAKEVIDVTAKYETFQAVLNNTLGQREAAKAFQLIQDYAAATPFQVDEITSSFIKLVNRGFKPTTEQLTSLGDLAASQGKSFDQLTEAILDAQSGEFERLKEFGIRASQSANNVTIAFRDQTVVVEKNSKAVRDAILAFGNLNGIAGSTAVVSRTLGGSISNLADEWDRFLNTIGKKTAPILTATFRNLSNFLGATSKAISDTGNATLSDQVRNNANIKKSIESFSKLNREQREEIIAAKERSLDPLYDIVAKELIPRQERQEEIGRLLRDSFLGDTALTAESKRISAALPQLLKTQQSLRITQTLLDELKATNEELNKAASQDVATPFGSAANQKDIRTTADVLEDLRKKLVQIDVQFAATGGALDKLSEDKIRAISSAIADLSDLGVRPGDTIFSTLKTQIDNLQSTLNRTPVTIQIPIKVDNVSAAETISNSVSFIRDHLEDDFTRAMQTDNPFSDILEKSLEDGFTSIAEGIGNAFKSGGGIQSVLGPFIDSIANFGNAMGKQLVATGIAVTAFGESLKNLQGYKAVAAGVALIAASSAFRAIASNGLASFATGGGVVGGPQLAMIGDNPGREEYVIPSEVLDKMGGGPMGDLRVALTGSEFIVWLERQYRING